jgi:tetratricopeptide (TPR) repeat protein
MPIRPRSVFLAAFFAALSAALGADVGGLMRHGNRLYAQGKFDEALGFYQRAEVLEPDALSIHYNLGNTLFRLNRHQEALPELTLAATDRDPGRRARALYNVGNVQYRANQLDNAINAYRRTLLTNPADLQAKQNLEFCLKKKQEQQNQQVQPDSSQRQSQQQQARPQPRQQQIDREQAEQMLQALQNQEKQTQKDLNQREPKRQVEQDW